jgi:hypothetical protein
VQIKSKNLKLIVVNFFVLSAFAKPLNVSVDYELSLSATQVDAANAKSYYDSHFDILICRDSLEVNPKTEITAEELAKVSADCITYKTSNSERNFYRLAKLWRGEGGPETFVTAKEKNESTHSKLAGLRIVELFGVRKNKKIPIENLRFYLLFHFNELNMNLKIEDQGGSRLAVGNESLWVESSDGETYSAVFEGDAYPGESESHAFLYNNYILTKSYFRHSFLIPWSPLEIGLDPQSANGNITVNFAEEQALKRVVIQQNLRQMLPEQRAQKYLPPMELYYPIVAETLLGKKYNELTILDIVKLQNIGNNPKFATLQIMKVLSSKKSERKGLWFTEDEISEFRSATHDYVSTASVSDLVGDYAAFYRSLALTMKYESEAIADELEKITESSKGQEVVVVNGQQMKYQDALARHQLYREQAKESAEAIDLLGGAFMDGINKVIK